MILVYKFIAYLLILSLDCDDFKIIQTISFKNSIIHSRLITQYTKNKAVPFYPKVTDLILTLRFYGHKMVIVLFQEF
jgi:hypothetical protein